VKNAVAYKFTDFNVNFQTFLGALPCAWTRFWVEATALRNDGQNLRRT